MKQPGIIILLCVLGVSLIEPVQAQKDTSAVGASQALPSPYIVGSSRPSSSAEVVATDVRLPKDGVRAGTSFEAFVMVYVAEGWHINAHEPMGTYLIGTTLDVEPRADLQVHAAYYPDPVFRTFTFTRDTLAVYEEEVAIILAMQAAPTLQPGIHRLTSRLQVQACNEEVCLRPSTVEVPFSVEVVADSR